MVKNLEICVFLSDSGLSARLGQLAAVQGWTILHWDTRPNPDLVATIERCSPDLIFIDNADYAANLQQTSSPQSEATTPLMISLSDRGTRDRDDHSATGQSDESSSVLHISAQSTDADIVAKITTALNVRRFSVQFFSESQAEPITKLPHHPELLEYMNRHLGEPVGLLVLQIDHADHLYTNLDPVSKTDLLGELGAFLHQQLPQDAVMGIFDAACFVAWLPGSQPNQVRTLANRFCSLTEQPISFSSGQLHFTISVGFGFEAALTNPQSLWHDTWVVKEKARTQGGNQVCGTSDGTMVGERIPDAFARDEFSLVLQPQWDASGTILRGVESLLRWQGMEVGSLAPDHFIPIAERSGQMARVGDWVLERAACESSTWLEHLVSPILLGINVSPQQFYNDAIRHQIERLAKDQWLDPSILELELSHNNLLDVVDQRRTTLYQLRDAGVRIAIDNLGTTVVDTQKLLRCPADTLKLDRSIIAQLDDDENTRRLVEQICQLGEKFQLRVVAVGVETESQRQILASLGNVDLQGYLLAEPIALEKFHRFLASHAEKRRVG